MFERVIQFIYRLVWAVILILAITAAAIIWDGLRDSAEHADLAIVPGHAEMETGEPWGIVQARLDRVIQLYQDKQISNILVSGSEKAVDYYEAGSMVQYLEGKGIPSSAIIGDEGTGDTQEMTARWVAKIKERNFTSVMVVTHYYQITRLKLALWQQAGGSIRQVHVGILQAADTYDIGRDDLELYRYLGKYYLGSTWRHARSEAKKIRQRVNGWLDSLVK